MSTLEEIETDLQRTVKTAATNPEDIPWQTRAAWGTAIEDARAKLPALKRAYKEALLRGGVAIFLDGDAEKAAAFAKLIRDSGEGLVADANALYERLARGVDATLSDARTWGVHQTAKLHRDLQEVMHEVGLTELPMPSRTEMPVVPKYEDTLAHVRKTLRDAVGDTLNNLYIAEQVLKGAMEIRYTGSVAPVAILNAAEEDRPALAKGFAKGGATVHLKADDTIDEEYLKKAFKDINKRIRKK